MSRLKVSIDFDAITSNVAALKQATTADVMAVVKADAYGHGLVEAAAAARAGGATWLGVAQPHEALTLRQAGDTGRILTWLYGPEVDARSLVERDIDVSANSLAVLDVITRAAANAGVPARVHIAVDTGLAREGATLADLDALLGAARAAQDRHEISVVGMWSHLAWADAPGHPTIDAQAQVFRAAIELSTSHGLTLEVRHLANSAATLTRPDLHFDLVRPGIAVYGLPPVPDPEGCNWGLRPAMSVTSSVVLTKRVPAGQGVSYGHDYFTSRETTLALVSAGYSDGIFRSVGNRAEVVIRGERFTIAGRVCMDQFVVDVGDHPVQVGDSVLLMGTGGPSAADWANYADTIDYEIVCRFGGLRPKGVA